MLWIDQKTGQKEASEGTVQNFMDLFLDRSKVFITSLFILLPFQELCTMLPLGTLGGMLDLLGLMPAPGPRPQEMDARQLLLRAVTRARIRRKGAPPLRPSPVRSARLFFLGAHAANDNKRSKSDAGTCA